MIKKEGVKVQVVPLMKLTDDIIIYRTYNIKNKQLDKTAEKDIEKCLSPI